VDVFRERANEVGVRNGEGLEVGDVRENNIGSEDFDGEIEEDKMGKVPKVGEGDDEDVAETFAGCDEVERGGELGREALGGGGGVKGQLKEEAYVYNK